LQTGDLQARDELISRACDRLQRLTRKMLRDFPRLRRWEESADILQNATLRLCRSLKEEAPANSAGFFALAALQIRRELIDMARHYYGPEGLGAKYRSRPDASADSRSPAPECQDGTSDRHPRRQPARRQGAADESAQLEAWTEFHKKVDLLPEEEKAVFNLLWYHELTQEEAARELGVSQRTLKRRWQSARLRLREALRDRQIPR
jgi:RNA polymerase sigma-70 factor (ECF subfamily)